MAISDEELVRRLESVPMVEAPDFRPLVLPRVAAAFRPPFGRLKPAAPRLFIGLAWAAAVAIVIGIAFFRPPSQQSSSATMAADFSLAQQGDRFLVKTTHKGNLEFDRTKLVKVGTLPDGTVILQRKPGASGRTEIVFHGVDGEIWKTSVAVN